jgi:uncharacterized protein
MLFKSRVAPTVAQRVRLMVWPRVSFVRSARYTVARVMRVKSTPHKIALGCAVGVFASITPFVGVQMAIAAGLALILRGNLVVAMLATFIGNPVSWPAIWGATYALGTVIIGTVGVAEAATLTPTNPALASVWPVLFPMLIGSIPLGLGVGAVSYGLVASTVSAAQRHETGSPLTRLKVILRAREPEWRLW